MTWLMLLLPLLAWVQLCVHELSHAAVFWWCGYRVQLTLWPHKHRGRWYLGRASPSKPADVDPMSRTAYGWCAAAPMLVATALCGLLILIGAPWWVVLVPAADATFNLNLAWWPDRTHVDINKAIDRLGLPRWAARTAGIVLPVAVALKELL